MICAHLYWDCARRIGVLCRRRAACRALAAAHRIPTSPGRGWFPHSKPTDELRRASRQTAAFLRVPFVLHVLLQTMASANGTGASAPETAEERMVG
jgi:hypothetical protein